MGMISFLKEAGEKLFGHKPEIAAAVAEPSNEEKVAAANIAASDAIKAYLRTQNLPADDLTITFDGAQRAVTVAGLVDSQEVREKVVLCCGNIQGVSAVVDELQTPAPADECTYHTVASGDNLSKIARTVYGDANKYPVIFEANKPMLTHPDKIYPGQVLRCPPLA